MKRRSLPLIGAILTCVVGCGSTTSSAVPVSTVPPESPCRSYLGAGVAVAMCSNGIAQGSQPAAPAPQGVEADPPFTITLHQDSTRSGSAPGIAQAMGNPLRDGERFDIGATPGGAELLLRLDISPRRASATGVFHIPASAASQEVEAEVSVDGGNVDAHLQLGSGERLPPAYIYVPAGY